MAYNIFETHAHYDDPCFCGQLDEVLRSQRESGVRYILNVSSNVPTSVNSVRLAASYDNVYAGVGVYPLEAEAAQKDWLLRITELAAHPKVKAIGEIGLDYHEKVIAKRAQRDVFCAQLELASQLNLPINVHNWAADEDMLSVLREYKPRGCVLHRFSSPAQYAEKFLDMGFYLSFCCSVTYPEWAYLLDIAKHMPLDRMVLETDLPFLGPRQLPGVTPTSAMISYVAEAIAAARDMSAQAILNATCQNAMRLLDICD